MPTTLSQDGLTVDAFATGMSRAYRPALAAAIIGVIVILAIDETKLRRVNSGE